MFKFAFKNLLIKKIQTIFVIFSIMISAGVAILAYNVSNQVRDGLINNAQYYSLIIGPSGSATQLAMNTMYFTDEPLGTIPYSLQDELVRDSRVKRVIPYAMADQYNGYKMVGTSSAFLDNKKIAQGLMFDDNQVFEVVVGSTVAKTCGLNIGDQIYTSHSGGEEHHVPFIVCGILEKSYSSADNVVFTQIKSIWEIHGHEHEEGEEHEEMENMVCAFLINTVNPLFAMQLQQQYNGKVITQVVEGEKVNYVLQAIEPMSVMRNVLEDNDKTQYIVYALTAVVLIMNVIVICIITLLNMYQSVKEIKLMRLIGISMKKINILYIIQNAFIGVLSILLAFGVSRIGLLLMGNYAQNMGVVLNLSIVYPMELIILLAVFIISVLPTIIWTLFLSKKDGLN